MAKRYFTKELGEAIARSALRVNSGRYHVISGNAQRWTVVSHGSVRPIRVFSTQREAVSFAKQKAFKQTGEVFIHGKTGLVSDTISFAK
jgi:Uncharacterized protein conserved in bacteria (DUF2188)